MKKKLLYAILGVAVVTSIAFGCKTTAPANVDMISEGVVAEISSDEVVIEVAEKEVASEEVKTENKTEKTSETKKENVKQESKESSSEKKSEKASEKVVADSGKTVAADTKKTTVTGSAKQTGTTTGQTTQTTNKVNTTNTTINTTKGTQTTQGIQTTGSTTQKATTVADNKPAQQTTTQQQTTQTTTQQTTQTTTQQTTQTNNTQTTTTTDNGNNGLPMPGTPEFEAAKAALEAQIAAQNQQEYQISSSDNQKLLDDINAYRAENGLNPLTWSDELGQQANTRAQEQTDNTVNNGGDIDHNYGTAHDDNARENLSSRQGDDVLEGWQNSPGHNNTLLDPNATSAGVATGNAGDGEGNGVTVLLIE